jgi:hypothetical protein
MKCIVKAMNETEYKPRAKWWGFVIGDFRYLCRYNHIFCVFSKTKVIYSHHETVTDKAGVNFAIKYFNENLKKEENGNN